MTISMYSVNSEKQVQTVFKLHLAQLLNINCFSASVGNIHISYMITKYDKCSIGATNHNMKINF